MAERERDSLATLDALARATDELCPAEDLTDAVIAAVDPVGDALLRARRETSDLEPSEGFSQAMMDALGSAPKVVQTNEPTFADGLVRWGRVALMGAAAAAALSLWLSSRAESTFDTVVLDSVALVEVGE